VFAEAVRKSPLTVPSSPTHDNQSLRGWMTRAFDASVSMMVA
jgi:hypothetical protein